MSTYKNNYSSTSSTWRGSSTTTSTSSGKLSSYSSPTSASYSPSFSSNSSGNSKSYSSSNNPYSSSSTSAYTSSKYESFKESRLASSGGATTTTAASTAGGTIGSGTEPMTSRFLRPSSTIYGSSPSKISSVGSGSNSTSLLREKSSNSGFSSPSSSSSFSRETSNLSTKSNAGALIREKLSTKLTDPAGSSYNLRTSTATKNPNINSREDFKKSTLCPNLATNSLNSGSLGNSASGNNCTMSTVTGSGYPSSRTLANNSSNINSQEYGMKSVSTNSSTSSTYRTAARFGLRATGNSPYSPHFASNNSSGLILPQTDIHKSGRSMPKSDEPHEWMSRGTSPSPIPASSQISGTEPPKNIKSSAISMDETPSTPPRKFDGVVKNKAVQTDKEKELFLSPPPKLALSSSLATSKYLSSIPRPNTSSPSFTASRLNSLKSGPDPKSTSEPEPEPAGLGELSRASAQNVQVHDTIAKRPPTDPNKNQNPCGISSQSQVQILGYHQSRPMLRSGTIQSSSSSPGKSGSNSPSLSPVKFKPNSQNGNNAGISPVRKNLAKPGSGSGGLPVRKSSTGGGSTSKSGNSSSNSCCSSVSSSRTGSVNNLNDPMASPGQRSRQGSEVKRGISETSSGSNSRSSSCEPNTGTITRNTNMKPTSSGVFRKLAECNLNSASKTPLPSESNQIFMRLKPLEKRTSPDGSAAVASFTLRAPKIRPPSTLEKDIQAIDDDYDYWSNLGPTDEEGQSQRPFGNGDQTNIDDILPLVETKKISPIPIPIQVPLEEEIACPSTTITLKYPKHWSAGLQPPGPGPVPIASSFSSGMLKVTQIASDDDDDESSSESEQQQGPMAGFDNEVDDDDASTGSCSSFEEIDPESISSCIDNKSLSSTLLRKPTRNPEGADLLSSSGSSQRQQLPCSSSSASALLDDSSRVSRATSGANNILMTSRTSCARMIPLPQNLQLDDATLQLYKDGDYGTYLDLEASISEQQEEFEGFLINRKNSIVLRAQLPVRVNAIIEKLLTADGRELRRGLFSLKQIFQEDKDLVHEFVENGGLSCLIKVGSEADQNYQNYILRAIGQVMLYVDGMYGVMRHNETIQWLYSLVASKFRLVQKTALKLLLVFVDYVESNCLLLVEAVHTVDSIKGSLCWSHVMSLLHDHDSSGGDTELLVYAMSLVNKVLNGIPDIDTYYDQVDSLEEQGMAANIQKFMGKQCADLDLIQQLQIYEVVLKHEDGDDEDCLMMQLDESMRQKLMNRKGYIELDGGNRSERRKSRRHSTNGLNFTPSCNGLNGGGSFSAPSSFPHHPVIRRLSSTEEVTRRDSDEWSSGCSNSGSSSHSSSPAPSTTGGLDIDSNMTPALRRRRERAERQKSLVREQQLLLNGNGHHADPLADFNNGYDNSDIESISLIPLGRCPSSKRDVHNLLSNVASSSNESSCTNSPEINSKTGRPWMLPVSKELLMSTAPTPAPMNFDPEKSIVTLKRENTVKDLTQKLANSNLNNSTSLPCTENTDLTSRIGDLTGIISKAKEGLAKSKSKVDVKSTLSPANGDVSTSGVCNGNGTAPGTAPNSAFISGATAEQKKSDNELHWDFLVSNLKRPLEICDLDFTGLKSDDDSDIISPHQLCNLSMNNGHMNGQQHGLNGFVGNGAPPPPPPGFGKIMGNGMVSGGPPVAPPPLFGVALKHQACPSSIEATMNRHNSNKTKKTVKLFWKEVREDSMVVAKIEDLGSIWDELLPIPLDTAKFEHLFESRAKDMMTKKQQEVNKFKEIVVLDPKRSNAINIAMTKLPPPRTIKTAILKMDATIINREGIEKLLAMLPTDEERAKIQEAQFANPETPLGSAEQFLITLASISELNARLKLWAFKLDYENLEKEIAEPLMDLKLGIEALQKNKTLKYILTTLLCIGNFLNGAEAKGFQIEYLAKIPEVKDTVHKHSLLHHLCHTVIEKFPESSDLYSEIGPVTRASRVDFDELGSNVVKMENDCKASWDHLRVISKHDGPTNMKLKMSEFLADTAERIIVLQIIHRRIIIRFHKFLLWLGVSAHQVTTTKPHVLFKIVSEFALEYRTTRDRVLQQVQKKANHRERNKTRGKMITEQILPNSSAPTTLTCNNTSKSSKEDKADAELRQVLSNTSGIEDGNGTWSRRKSTPNGSASSNTTFINGKNGLKHNSNKFMMSNGFLNGADAGDDEILESLVKTATQTPATRTIPRERKRNNSRYTDRKSLRRTLRHGLSEEERSLLAAFMANGHTFS